MYEDLEEIGRELEARRKWLIELEAQFRKLEYDIYSLKRNIQALEALESKVKAKDAHSTK